MYITSFTGYPLNCVQNFRCFKYAKYCDSKIHRLKSSRQNIKQNNEAEFIKIFKKSGLVHKSYKNEKKIMQMK